MPARHCEAASAAEAIHVKPWIAAPYKKRRARNDTQNVSAGIQRFLKSRGKTLDASFRWHDRVFRRV